MDAVKSLGSLGTASLKRLSSGGGAAFAFMSPRSPGISRESSLNSSGSVGTGCDWTIEAGSTKIGCGALNEDYLAKPLGKASHIHGNAGYTSEWC